MLCQKSLDHLRKTVSFRILRKKTLIPKMPPSPYHGEIDAYPSTRVILRYSSNHVGIQRLTAIHELFFADFAQSLDLVTKKGGLLIFLGMCRCPHFTGKTFQNLGLPALQE